MATRGALVLLATLAALVALGLALTRPEPVVLAGAGFVAFGLAFARAVPTGRRLRRERLELAWWLDHGTGLASGSAVPGPPFDVRCYVRHRGSRSLDVIALEPLLPEGLELVRAPEAIRFEAGTRTEFAFRLRAATAGRCVVHGLALTVRGPLGLFATPLYFPNPLALRVLPRAAAARSRHRAPLRSRAERAGRASSRRRGGGTELHELRDLQPGDPFKAIAWKASARRGRLMVREVEQEVQESRFLVVDVSGTMRGGPLGERPFDDALEVAASEARRGLDAGDRVGLVTFGARVVHHVPAGEGAAQRLRLYDALLGATDLVDEDLTDIDASTLATRVARYVRKQDGVDYFRRGAQGTKVELAGLVAHARKVLGATLDARRVVAKDPGERVLRRFCQERGLPLPHRADPEDGAKAAALAEALRLAARGPAGTVRVLTDLDGVRVTDALLGAVRFARARGHRVIFQLYDASRFPGGAPPGDLGDLLRDLQAPSERRRLRELAHGVRAAGARAELVGPGGRTA